MKLTQEQKDIVTLGLTYFRDQGYGGGYSSDIDEILEVLREDDDYEFVGTDAEWVDSLAKDSSEYDFDDPNGL